MGQKNSNYYKTSSFTEDQVKAIEDAFDITRQDSFSIDSVVFIDKWRDYMVSGLLDVWINFLFPLQKGNIDWSRFSYLHKGQTSHFMEEKAKAIIRVLMNVDKDTPVLTLEVEQVKEYFRAVIASYLRSLGSFENVDFFKWLKIEASTYAPYLTDVIDYLTADLNSIGDTSVVGPKEVEEWLRTKTIVADILNGFLDISYGLVDIGSQSCVLPQPNSYFPTILDVSQIIFLCSHLTKNYTRRWKLKFHNQGHGSNYTLLCKTIIGVGPNIMLIKDHGNHVFGYFASDSWRQSSTFYGDNRCFLFQLSPNLRLFEPSGFNTNFMYHNQNQHTLPNGFGMGGQIGFWGLWVDGDFGKGECSDFCSTFTDYIRPSVSSKFTFTHIEVWAVTVEENEEEERIPRYRGSVIDSDPLARAIIEMTGRNNTFHG